MDAVLRRMLDVEKEAEAIVAEAEAKAEAIADKGRQAVTELREQFRAETGALAEACIRKRVDEAEAEKQRAMAEAEHERAEKVEAFRRMIAGRAGRIAAALAYPFGGPQA